MDAKTFIYVHGVALISFTFLARDDASTCNSLMCNYLDLIHLLAWQKLMFYHQLRHSSNTVVFTCFSIYSMTVSVIICSCVPHIHVDCSIVKASCVFVLKDILKTFVWRESFNLGSLLLYFYIFSEFLYL